MTNTTISDDWTGIPEEVEKIIASRTVKTQHVIGAVVTDVTRPFKFVDFVRESGITYRRAHSYIRQSIIPSSSAKRAIISWCKKNRRKGK
jgi:hypothetical protein